ncbi:PDDEXK nuclease domain-containing protein [Rhodoferax sp.]|uniref:PDDEXK nuclease domain-containing protein n=1 Tax=Rhodoferax sp. TaxID=50421 RepID=UPI0025F93788|nr:PDDEXK nuclease domain-containing protein [Rhodoferax sp.]
MNTRKKTALTPPANAKSSRLSMDFTALVAAIGQVHAQSAAAVSRAINTTLTLRNWVIGWYIREYEQQGADRATYGEAIINRLAEALAARGMRDLAPRTLRQCRQFYTVYPLIWQAEAAKSLATQLAPPIWQALSAISPVAPAAPDRATGGAMAHALAAPIEKLFTTLSFSHLAELISIEDPLKRAFYEIECIRGNWAVRALKRQIDTLYFERSALSKDKEKLAAMVRQGIEAAEPRLAIRDPYIFEFLGLRAQDAVAESDLEAALVANLREFLLELGHGFCLEAQQKSILIGKTRSFVDLVFYHRILKCHVLVELKVDKFTHEHIGQLNTYVTWYRKHMMMAGDNPPVGLLLCTDQDHTLVEYATASMDNQLFVSKYQLELPSKEELQKFLEITRKEVLGPP